MAASCSSFALAAAASMSASMSATLAPCSSVASVAVAVGGLVLLVRRGDGRLVLFLRLDGGGLDVRHLGLLRHPRDDRAVLLRHPRDERVVLLGHFRDAEGGEGADVPAASALESMTRDDWPSPAGGKDEGVGVRSDSPMDDIARRCSQISVQLSEKNDALGQWKCVESRIACAE